MLDDYCKDMHFIDCYENFGENYMGRVHRTDKGTLCVKWVLSPKINPQTHPDRVSLKILQLDVFCII